MNEKLQTFRANISFHPARKWFILSTVLMGATMSALDVSILNLAMPTLKSAFGVSMAVAEWIAITYVLTLTAFLPLFGRLSDIHDKSKLYNVGFVVFSAGSLLCGMSTTAAFLIISRVVQAIGAGLLQANSVALVTNAFPPGERSKAIGVQGAIQAIAMAAGPFVGGILISTAGWRSIFYINIPVGILGTLAALFILPHDQKIKEREKVDYQGAAFFASGLAFIVLAFNEAARLGWSSGTIMCYFLAGIILLALFIIIELKVEHPLVDIRRSKNAIFPVGSLASTLSYFVLLAILFRWKRGA